MEQQNNTASLNDTAGVLPMDTGVTVNGIHDEGDNTPSSSANTSGKKGRGRPPKSASSTKGSIKSFDTPKRARGRPPKTGEPTPITKKVVVPTNKKEEAPPLPPTNGDASKKKRGRPSKTSTPDEQINGMSKLQIQSAPISNEEEQENGDEPTKRKRGRPSGVSPKKAVVAVQPPAPKEISPTKKRGRPSGSAGVKKPAPKAKAPASNDGSARKRGRPKKATASPSAAATTTLVNETTASVTPNNVQ